MMTRWRLLRANLRYFRATNLTVAAGVAAATAVLTGAMMVGDSVRGSLVEMADRRLGPVTHAITSPIPFDASLAERLGELAAKAPLCEPAMILRGSAARGDESARVAGVRIIGAEAELVDVKAGHCIVNARFADTLDVAVGDAVLLSVPRTSRLPADAALSRRERSRQLAALRLAVQQVVREPSFESEFSLTATQRPEPGLWLPLADLQRALDREGQANTILLRIRDRRTRTPLGEALREAAELGDYGLTFEQAGVDRRVLVSSGTYLPAAVESALPETIAHNCVTVNLTAAVRIVDAEPARLIRYAVVAGLSSPPGGNLAADEIALNAWAAEQLGAKPGDRIALSWYERSSDGTVVEVHSDRPPTDLVFRVARIAPMTGLGAEATLTPTYEGLTDAATVAEWDPPADLPIDLDLVTDADERYWKEYRAAPKLFVDIETARRLWDQPYGYLTGVRVAASDADTFAAAVKKELRPETMGFQVRPVRDEQLAAARGGTDFAGLYLSLSFFLIAAAAILVALLMRLSVEQRARQLGLMAALGFTPRAIRRLALAEGMIVSLVGVLGGLLAASWYTGAIMTGLRTWWFDAVGATSLRLHTEWTTVVVGGFAGLIVAAGAVAWGTRRIGRTGVAALLAGRWAVRAMAVGRTGRRSILVALVAFVAGVVLVGMAATGTVDAKAGALGGGAMLIVAGLSFLDHIIRPHRRGRTRIRGVMALDHLAIANAGRRPTRTLLAAGLLAFTVFVLVILAAFRTGPSADTHEARSGAGGFTLTARPDIPLPVSPATVQGRRLIGMPNADDPVWDRAAFLVMRRRGGQDASCLNITRPTDPAILSVPRGAFAGRFAFARTVEDRDDPWSLLIGGKGFVPIITDDATARWILHLELGDALEVTDHHGEPRQLRLVGTLAGSIFQSELLMDEANFRRLFPAATGAGALLVATDPTDTQAVGRALATGLADYGAAVEPTSDLLGRLAEVANTYLSAFQVLGALGLLLGVVGLTVVLLRNLLERRSELALLSALGLSPRRRLRLLLTESMVALNAGAGAGLAAGIIAGAPVAGRPVNWGALLAAFACILLVGWGSQAVAATAVGRRVRPADLRRE